MIKARHTHEEFAVYIGEASKPGNDMLCCVMNEVWKCGLCRHPICTEHLCGQHYCKRCETFLLKYD